MRIRWNKIILISILIFLFSCQYIENKEIDIDENKTSEIILNWTETEVLHQKFTAERKWNDTLKCISTTHTLTTQQKDSILKFWSHHPQEIRKLVVKIIEDKEGK